MPVEKCQGVDILFGRYIKGCIEGRIETLHHPLLLALILVMRLQEEGTERRTEGQCVDRRNSNRYDQGHAELFVENTGRACNEGHRRSEERRVGKEVSSGSGIE